MKKVKACLISLMLVTHMQAKKVKFEVDLGSQAASPNGVHLSGDFQHLLGVGPNWDPGKLSMTQVGSSSIYQVVVNIPAFKKYEYRFVNGDQTYEVEFVPEASRVGWVFGSYSDNRWIYVDSLSADTQAIGAIVFGGNAPAGKYLVRYKIDMSDANGSSLNGVHLGTSYQVSTFDPTNIRLFSFEGFVHEVINYVSISTNTIDYIYYNGKTITTAETVPSGCNIGGKRRLSLQGDTVLSAICFSSCGSCLTVGKQEMFYSQEKIGIYPNPASSLVNLLTNSSEEIHVVIFDLGGKKVVDLQLASPSKTLDVSNFQKGFYLVKIQTATGYTQTKKLIVD